MANNFVSIFPNMFLPTDCPIRTKFSQAQGNWFVFLRRHWLVKDRGAQICAPPI